MERTYIKVILPLKIEWEPYYYITGEELTQAKIGSRVKVLFSGKTYVGVICMMDVTPDIEKGKILCIQSLETSLSIISPQELALWDFVAEYYMCTKGEVYKAAYPGIKISGEYITIRAREKKEMQLEKRIAENGKRRATLEERLIRKTAIAEKARPGTKTELSAREAIQKISDELKALEDVRKSIETALKALRDTDSSISNDLPGDMVEDVTIRRLAIDRIVDSYRTILSEPQQNAYCKIEKAFSEGKPALLAGVTGSGKTELYIKAAVGTLKEGRNVLYMVPEIALSRQLEHRLKSVFGDLLQVFHSKETAALRSKVSETVRNRPYVVLGTRSSVFLPYKNLGLVIIDEEHDTSYKQEDNAPRYNGRDVAIMMGSLHKCNVLLGSATPSLESLYNCRIGRYDYIPLHTKYFGAGNADLMIIDTSAERRKNGMVGNFSRKLIREMELTLAKGRQILILRSRKAYSPAVQCTECGEIPLCPHCNVPLAYHKAGSTLNGYLSCGYCGYNTSYSGKCPKCNGEMQPMGTGTQKIEEEAARLFPQARIARIDGDVTKNPKEELGIIRSFASGETDILIGTQIISKGFDFKGLALVAVIGSDSIIGQQDFRADERSFQLLEQFRGRCGRRDEKGLFVIQTNNPSHPVYRRLEVSTPELNETFSEALLAERRIFGYPPFSRIITIIIKDNNERRIRRISDDLAEIIRDNFHLGQSPCIGIGADEPLKLLGPTSPIVDKIADLHIRHIRLILRRDLRITETKRNLRNVIEDFIKKARYPDHISINVDPV